MTSMGGSARRRRGQASDLLAQAATGIAAEARRWAADQGRIAAGARLAHLREVVLARRDPARLHARRLRRARHALAFRSVAAAGLGWLTAVVGARPGLEPAELAWGGATAVVAAGAVAAVARPLSTLRRPARDCPARGPIDRLAERERVLAGLLAHLGPEAAEPRAVAADASAILRDLGARVAVVDRARRGAPPGSAAGLDAAVAVLVGQLEAGVVAYDSLVLAAAEAVAASASLRAGDPLLTLRLTEATDTLAGLAAGLREVTGPTA
jgi:hypothetical protein